MKLLLAGFYLLLGLAGNIATVSAQEEEQEEQQSGPNEESPAIEDTRTDSPRTEGSSADDSTAAADDVARDRDAADAGQDGLPRDPGEPFVPSVQISEDLSVSFPVDI